MLFQTWSFKFKKSYFMITVGINCKWNLIEPDSISAKRDYIFTIFYSTHEMKF